MDRGILCLWSLCYLACSQYLPDLIYTYFTSTHLFWVLCQNREQPQNMVLLLETVQSRSGRQTKNKKANGYLWPPYVGFPDGSVDKESACNAGNTGVVGTIPELGRSPRVGHGNSLQYSCLENSMDRGAWWAPVHEVTKTTWHMSWRRMRQGGR